MLVDDGSIRMMTLNLWHNDVDVPARLAAAAAEVGARSPEVLCLQEVMFRLDGTDTASELAELTGLSVVALLPVYSFGGEGHRSGLAVLSKLPVISAPISLPLPGGDARDQGRAALVVFLSTPAGRPLVVATTHLAWGAVAEAARLRQVMALDAYFEEVEAHSPGAVCVLAGDLNAAPHGDSLGFLKGLRVFGDRSTYWVDTWAVAGDGPGYTNGPENPYVATTAQGAGILDPSVLPNRRIDYVLVRGYAYGRPGHPIAARVAFSFPAASDHWGVEVDLWDPPAH